MIQLQYLKIARKTNRSRKAARLVFGMAIFVWRSTKTTLGGCRRVLVPQWDSCRLYRYLEKYLTFPLTI